MDSYDVNCGLEMDCEEEIDDEDVFRTFLCRGNKEVEVTDQGDMYIIKNNSELSDIEDIAEVGEESGELKGTFECPEEDISKEDESEEDVLSSEEEEDDRNDKDWTGSDAASSSDGSSSSSSSCEDDTDEEIGRELEDLAGKVQVNRKKNVSSGRNLSVFCKKKKERGNTKVPVSGRKDKGSNIITVLRIGLDNQVLSRRIITDEKSVQITRKIIKDGSKIESAQMSAMEPTKLNLQQIKQGNTPKILPGKIIKIIKVVQPKFATNASQTLNVKADCSQSYNTNSIVVREKANNQMSCNLIPVKKEADLTESGADMINSSEKSQAVCKLKISSVISQAVGTGEIASSMNKSMEKGDNSSTLPGRVLKGGVTSSLEALSVGQENCCNMVIKQEPTDDYETCNMTFKQEPSDDFEPCKHKSIIKASKDDLEPSSKVAIQQKPQDDLEAYKHVTIKQEPRDDLDFNRTVSMVVQSDCNSEHCSYLAVMNDHNYCCRSDVDTPGIKEETHDDVSMGTGTAVTHTMLKEDSLGGRSVESNSCVSVPSQPSHLHLKRKQSAETNTCVEKKLTKNIKLDQSTSLKSTMKFPAAPSLLTQLKSKIQSSQSEVKPSPIPLTTKLLSSQSTLKPTSSQCAVQSTSLSKVQSTSSLSKVQSTSSPSKVQSTSSPSEVQSTSPPSEVQSTSLPSKVQSTSSLSKVQSTSSLSKVQSTSSLSKVQSTSSLSKVQSTSSLSKVQSTSPLSKVQSTSSLSKEQSTPSQSAVHSTSTSVKSATSQTAMESTSSQSTVKLTLHPIEKTIVPSKYTIKQMSQFTSVIKTLPMSRKTIANNADNKRRNKKKLLRKDRKDEPNNLCPVCKRCFPSTAEMTKHCALHYVHTSHYKFKHGAYKSSAH